MWAKLKATKHQGSITMAVRNEANVGSVSVFHINYIVIRIRIRRSVPLPNESGSGSCCLRQWPWPSRRQPKIFCYAFSFLKVHFHHSSKIKSHKEVPKTLKMINMKVFLTIFAWWWKNPDPSGQKSYGTMICTKDHFKASLSMFSVSKKCSNFKHWPYTNIQQTASTCKKYCMC